MRGGWLRAAYEGIARHICRNHSGHETLREPTYLRENKSGFNAVMTTSISGGTAMFAAAREPIGNSRSTFPRLLRLQLPDETKRELSRRGSWNLFWFNFVFQRFSTRRSIVRPRVCGCFKVPR